MDSNHQSQRFSALVEDLSNEGLGVVRKGSQVFFVPGVWPGDEGEFEIQSLEKRYGHARLIRLTHLSPSRRAKVPCPHHGFSEGRCGGCPWMFATDEAQREAKIKRLQHSLSRAQLDVETLLPLKESPTSLHYRNRAQFKIQSYKLGFVSHNSKDLAPIDSCLVLNEPMSQLLQVAQNRFAQNPISPSDYYPNENWAFLDVDDHMTPADIENARLNRRRAFRQGNTAQNEFMKDFIKNEIQNLSRQTRWVELFCGSGNFTEVLVSSSFEKITAVEVVPQALENLKKRFPKIETLRMDLGKEAHFHILGRKLKDVEAILLDPPRTGARGLEHFVEVTSKLTHIIYVSCDLNSFVRDAQKLKRLGFSLEKLQPLDQFPQTPHLELIGVFTTRRLHPRR